MLTASSPIYFKVLGSRIDFFEESILLFVIGNLFSCSIYILKSANGTKTLSLIVFMHYFVNYLKNLVDKCSNFTSAYAQVGAFSVIVQLHRLIVYSTTPERCVSDLIRRLCIGAAAQCR